MDIPSWIKAEIDEALARFSGNDVVLMDVASYGRSMGGRGCYLMATLFCRDCWRERNGFRGRVLLEDIEGFKHIYVRRCPQCGKIYIFYETPMFL